AEFHELEPLAVERSHLAQDLLGRAKARIRDVRLGRDLDDQSDLVFFSERNPNEVAQVGTSRVVRAVVEQFGTGNVYRTAKDHRSEIGGGRALRREAPPIPIKCLFAWSFLGFSQNL